MLCILDRIKLMARSASRIFIDIGQLRRINEIKDKQLQNITKAVASNKFALQDHDKIESSLTMELAKAKLSKKKTSLQLAAVTKQLALLKLNLNKQ